MRCPDCAADVAPLRDFCPKCGTPTDPDLRESLLRRSGGRPTDQQKRNRNTLLIGGAAILLALGVAGQLSWAGWPGPTIHIDSDDRPRGPVTIEADQLYQAYRDDADAAAKRFDGREMVVSGEFLRIVPDGWGSLDLRLKTSNPEAPLGIDVAQLAIEEAKQLQPGQRVTVSCQHMGEGGDELWVQDCAIQSVGEGSAAPSPPTPSSPSAPPPGQDK